MKTDFARNVRLTSFDVPETVKLTPKDADRRDIATMKLYGEVEIRNLLMASVDTRPKKKPSNACVSIGKKSLNDVAGSLQICTNSNKTGTIYKLKDNVEKVFNRFAHEGKCTIRTKDPPHEILISKANPVSLKSFLAVLKCCAEGKVPSEGRTIYLAPTTSSELSHMKKKLTIVSRSDYPTTSNFPSRLEQLTVTCNLKSIDMRILALRHLSTLDLSDNNIRKVPDNWESAVTLSQLNLSRNEIGELPKGFVLGRLKSQLTFLDLSRNRIAQLPNAICNFDKLLELGVSTNKLTALPHRIFSMARLRKLNVSDNQLRILPGTRRSSSWLDAIDVSGNMELKSRVTSVNLDGLKKVPTLEEWSSRAVLNHRIPYSEQSVPFLVKFCLDAFGRTCLGCGRQCLDFRAVLRSPSSVALFSRSSTGFHDVLAEFFLCSWPCWGTVKPMHRDFVVE